MEKTLLMTVSLILVIGIVWFLYRHILYLQRERNHDPLTRALNRAGFDQLIREKRELSRGPISVVFIDLMDFKNINDRYGHASGNKAIRTVVKVIGENIRERDILIRPHGDEFYIIFPGVGEAAVGSVRDRMARIEEELSRTNIESDSGQIFTAQISYGIATTERRPNIDALLHEADEAMYLDKEEKRKRGL